MGAGLADVNEARLVPKVTSWEIDENTPFDAVEASA
jgi:hypothetical protein